MKLLWKLICLAAVLALGGSARADTITIVASRDTSIYEDFPGNSDGGGPTLFTGMTRGLIGEPSIRRALLFFDVAALVPAGSTINSVQVMLTQDRPAMLDMSSRNFTLNRSLAAWGEGTAGAGMPIAGMGSPTPPDGTSATWSHRFFNTLPWTTPGGDFAATFSGLTVAPVPPGFDLPVLFDSTAPMSAGLALDVQNWLDNPASNLGWFLLGNEGAGTVSSARRLYSREADNPNFRPQLVIDFTPSGPPPSGDVPEPASLTLLGLGAVALGWYAHRRRAAR